jgi:hypothetical protein
MVLEVVHMYQTYTYWNLMLHAILRDIQINVNILTPVYYAATLNCIVTRPLTALQHFIWVY